MKLLFKLMLGLGVGIALAYYYAIFLDPEMQLYGKELYLKHELANRINSKKVIFIGGSSCAHSVKPDLFLAENIPCVNMGYHAGAGAPFLTAHGMAVAEPGDLVVFAMEPRLLLKDKPVSRVALTGSLMVRDLSFCTGGQFTDKKLSLEDLVFTIRPDGWRLSKSLAVFFVRYDVFSHVKLDEFGWMNCTLRTAKPIERFSEFDGFDEANQQLLRRLVEFCRKREISIVVAIPWRLCESEDVESALAWDKAYINEISKIMPVLLETESAVLTNSFLFSNTSYHLDEEGAVLRSEAYIKALYRGDVMIAGVHTNIVLLDEVSD